MFEESVQFKVETFEKSEFSFAVECVRRVVESSEVRIAEDVGRTRRFVTVTAGRVSLLQIPFAGVIVFEVVPVLTLIR